VDGGWMKAVHGNHYLNFRLLWIPRMKRMQLKRRELFGQGGKVVERYKRLLGGLEKWVQE
jgi:hypothetical protein